MSSNQPFGETERTDLDDNDRAIATFTMVAHALVHWFELAIPIFLVIWVGEFDVSVGLLGVIVALGYAPFGIGALPSGLLADRYGAKRLVVICLAGMSVSLSSSQSRRRYTRSPSV